MFRVKIPGGLTPVGPSRAGLCLIVIAWLSALSGNAAMQAAAPRAQEGHQTIWDAVFTEAQAERGEHGYVQACARCHADDLLGSSNAPPLVGDPFFIRFERKTVDDMVDAIRRTMPQEAPDSLGLEAYTDIVAYLFKANGSPAGDLELPADRDKLRLLLVTSRAGR